MMKKLIYISFISLFFASCEMISDIDEIKPHNQMTEENTYVVADKVEAAMDGCYSAFRSFTSTYHASYSLEMAGLFDSYFGSSIWMEVLIDIDDWTIESMYDEKYIIITRANYIIKNIESKKDGDIMNLSEDRRIEILAEAKIARALAHFDLLTTFGQHYDLDSKYGIAVVDKVIEGNEGPSRNTVQETYDAIISDLDYGIANAPQSVSRTKFCSSSAKAFKARIALFMKDYKTAAALSLELINTGDYELIEQYGDVFREGFESEEIIFSPYGIVWDEFINVRGVFFDSPSARFKMLADGEVDAVNDGDDVSGLGYDPRYAYSLAIDSLLPGIRCMKWPQGYDEGSKSNSIIYMRGAELYLIYAEAVTRDLNAVDADAVAKLNAVRARAGYTVDLAPSSPEEMLSLVRKEKTLELFGEYSQDWFDMVRYHFLGDIDIMSIKPSIKDNYQLVMPIPAPVLAGNRNIEQNPMYASAVSE